MQLADLLPKTRDFWNGYNLDHYHCFAAGIVAKLIVPGENEPKGFVLTTILALWGLSSRHIWGRHWGGTTPTRAPGSSEPSSVP